VATIFNYFAQNQLIKFSARDAGDFSEAAGEREMAPKCGLAGNLVGLQLILSKHGSDYANSQPELYFNCDNADVQSMIDLLRSHPFNKHEHRRLAVGPGNARSACLFARLDAAARHVRVLYCGAAAATAATATTALLLLQLMLLL